VICDNELENYQPVIYEECVTLNNAWLLK